MLRERACVSQIPLFCSLPIQLLVHALSLAKDSWSVCPWRVPPKMDSVPEIQEIGLMSPISPDLKVLKDPTDLKVARLQSVPLAEYQLN